MSPRVKTEVHMNKSLIFILGFAGAFALHAADGDVLATTGSAASFKFNTSEVSPFAMASTADATALFAEQPVTWRAGETVSMEAPDGTATTVSTALSGTYAFSPASSGVWSLSNSDGGKVYVSIPWAITGGAICTSGASAFAVDTKESGPNRKSYKKEVLPIAYSGDGWCGSKTSASTLTLTSPTGAAAATPFTGVGTMTFVPDKIGNWAASLALEDGTTLSSVLTIIGHGFIISFF